MKKPSLSRHSTGGFTLLEVITTAVIIGILSAIAIPSFIGLINRQRLNNAQEQVLIAMRTAQANAKRERRTWEACFRNSTTNVLWSVHPVLNANWNCSQSTNWQPLLGEDAKFITIANSTLPQSPPSSGYYRSIFRYDGAVPEVRDKGKVTLAIRNETSGSKRCVIVSTLLGALRTDKDANCN